MKINKIDLEKQIMALKSHPDFNEVVRSIGIGQKTNTLIVLLQNGNWFEIEFLKRKNGEMFVNYGVITKPDALTQKILDWLQSGPARN